MNPIPMNLEQWYFRLTMYTPLHFHFCVCSHVKCHKLMHKFIAASFGASQTVSQHRCGKMAAPPFGFSLLPTLSNNSFQHFLLCKILHIAVSLWDLAAYPSIHSRFMRDLREICWLFLSWACKICSSQSWRETLFVLQQHNTVFLKERN